MRVPESVQAYHRQLQVSERSGPVLCRVVRTARGSVPAGKDEPVIGGLAHAEAQALFLLLFPMLPQFGNDGGGEADSAPPMLRLRCLEAQPRLSLFERLFDCSPSAPLRQIEGLHDGRISGSS